MLDFLKEYPFLAGALSGSLAAYLLGLIVQYLRRPKKWLGYSVTGRRIAEKGNPKLVVHYDRRDIQCLHSFSIQLRNIGNQPLRDVPVTVQVTSPAEIVESDVSVPAGAKFEQSVSSQNKLIVSFDLLNKQEEATIDLTTINAPGKRVNENVLVVARQENLECHKMLPPDLPFASDPVMRFAFKVLKKFIV